MFDEITTLGKRSGFQNCIYCKDGGQLFGAAVLFFCIFHMKFINKSLKENVGCDIILVDNLVFHYENYR